MASISKNVFIDKLDDIVNKYKNKHHKTIYIKHFDVKQSMYIHLDPKFKVCYYFDDIIKIADFDINNILIDGKTIRKYFSLELFIQKFD